MRRPRQYGDAALLQGIHHKLGKPVAVADRFTHRQIDQNAGDIAALIAQIDIANLIGVVFLLGVTLAFGIGRGGRQGIDRRAPRTAARHRQ